MRISHEGDTYLWQAIQQITGKSLKPSQSIILLRATMTNNTDQEHMFDIDPLQLLPLANEYKKH